MGAPTFSREAITVDQKKTWSKGQNGPQFFSSRPWNKGTAPICVMYPSKDIHATISLLESIKVKKYMHSIDLYILIIEMS